ncbi:MAG: hypothetical protein B6242_02050 [Anaerolineaceae bacterium 4572_78]|nr:MAG: hypothetical protein B6242_02050 [Anaerolineaceae bacterium 4572_78]
MFKLFGNRTTQDRLDQFVSGVDEDEDVQEKKPEEQKSTSQLTKTLDKAFADKGFAQKTRTAISRANLKITVAEYMMIRVIVAVAASGFSFVLFDYNTYFTVGGFVLGFFMLPPMYLSFLANKRVSKFNGQLGDTITMMANGLRSGFSVQQAMESVAKEMPPPISVEFSRVVREIGLGLPSQQAMNNMMRRIPSEDLELMITAINIQSEVGGNLAEILEIIGAVIRERVKIVGEVKTMTSQGQMSGTVISLLPILLGAALYAMNPIYMGRMFQECPNCAGTPYCGYIMTGTAIFLVVSGYFAIQQATKVEL